MALRSPKTPGPVARRRAAARPRVIGGSASPRSPEFFQKTSPVFKSFSKVYYARIVKSPLIPALPAGAGPEGLGAVRRARARVGPRRAPVSDASPKCVYSVVEIPTYTNMIRPKFRP